MIQERGNTMMPFVNEGVKTQRVEKPVLTNLERLIRYQDEQKELAELKKLDPVKRKRISIKSLISLVNSLLPE